MPALNTDLKAGAAVLIGCPYCGKIVSKVPLEGILEVACLKCGKRREWHEGVFRVTAFTLTEKKARNPEKNLPGKYNLKGIKSNAKFEISFYTMDQIELNKGDIISLSYSKSPKSVLNLTWNGHYKNKPSVLVNNRTRKIHRI
ncbi:hypothetical protein JW865_05050 [Candidatus Bathyarchaeota archaeon]|nr:hypothetical protein [Candidatus Bathyarchaeota archaeon]